jgi:hypothetical protein
LPSTRKHNKAPDALLTGKQELRWRRWFRKDFVGSVRIPLVPQAFFDARILRFFARDFFAGILFADISKAALPRSHWL